MVGSAEISLPTLAGGDQAAGPAHAMVAQTRSLRTTLCWLVAACMLPVLITLVTLSVSAYTNERDRQIFKLVAAGRVLMDAVDDEFRVTEVALQSLLTSPALVNRDYAALREQAQGLVRRGFTPSVVLVDGTGQQLMNTAVPASTPLPRIPDQALVKTVQSVLASGKTSVSSLFLGPVQKKPLAMVTVPEEPLASGVAMLQPTALTPQYVLAGVRLPASIQATLMRQNMPTDWVVSVIDPSFAIAARTTRIGELLGKPAGPDVLKLLAERQNVVVEGITRDGVPVLLHVLTSKYSGWSVAQGVPLASFNAELRGPYWWVVGLTAATIGLSLLMAWSIGGRMSRTVALLRDSARKVGDGQVVVVPDLSFREANEVGDAIRKASQTIMTTTASLRDSESRMRGILASAKDAIITFDDTHNVLIFNTAAAQMFQCDEADALGRPITDFIPDRFHDRHYEYIRAYRSMGETFGKAVALRRSGTEFPVEVSYSNVELPGSVLHTLIIRDITGSLANIKALKRSNHDLQQFAFVASHDLKNPLRSISGLIQLLQRKYAHGFEAGALSLIERTREATLRLEQLTDDLLTYARVNSEVAPLVPVDLNNIATEAVRLLDAVITERGATVVVETLPTVRGAHTQLLQLLLNLIGNGLKYCKDRPPAVRVFAMKKANDWVVSVQDNGIGIEEKHYGKIFEVFKRLHNQSEYSGTGIGLAVCQRVVQHHGGEISVTSVAGEGSTFTFTIGQLTKPEDHNAG